MLCYASYLTVPGFKATAIRQISITEFIQALTGQQKDDHNLLVKIVYALIRTKLSKKQADLEQLTNFGLEIENMGLNRNQLNPTLFCWLLYTYSALESIGFISKK